MAQESFFLQYRRARFQAQFPHDYFYTQSHFWLAPAGQDLWRVGLTKFGTRLLGEMVDHGYTAKPGMEVSQGQIIGWLEGFKAISDLFCVMKGRFARENPALLEQLTLINKDPHGEGWLYEIHGNPGPECCKAEDYARFLDGLIDRLSDSEQAAH